MRYRSGQIDGANGQRRGKGVDLLLSGDHQIAVEKGVLANIEQTSFTNRANETYEIQILEVTKVKNIRILYEFMTKHSTSEFSYSSWFSNRKFISTSFDPGEDQSINVLYKRYHYLLHHVHSHPDGYLDPSPGDTQTVEIFNRILGYEPRFELYSPISGQYKDYDQNTTWELEEIIINGD